MFQALSLAVLTWLGMVTPSLPLLAFVLSCLNALDMAVRQSLMVYLVQDRSLLPNVIALNAASCLDELLALAALCVRPVGDASKHPLHALREGLGYTFGHRDIRLFLMLVAAVCISLPPTWSLCLSTPGPSSTATRAPWACS